jgi:hypothetical protein
MTANKNGQSVRSILLAPTAETEQAGSMLKQLDQWIKETGGEVHIDCTTPYFRVRLYWYRDDARFYAGGSETTLQDALDLALKGYHSCR